jgi:ATP-binding cassette subfamily B protein
MRADLADDFTTERWPADRVVVQQGDLADRFYVIVRGTVRATRVDDDGHEAAVNVLEDGDYFGELALLHDLPRTATVRTVTPSVLLTLTRDKFLRLLERAPELRDGLRRDYPELTNASREAGQ